MIVKLDYDVDTCIQLYKELSREIFSRSHWFGKATGGFGRVKKFSGKHLRDVLVKKVIEPGLQQWQSQTADSYHLEEIERHRELSW